MKCLEQCPAHSNFSVEVAIVNILNLDDWMMKTLGGKSWRLAFKLGPAGSLTSPIASSFSQSQFKDFENP